MFNHGIGAGLFGFQQVDVIEAWIPLFLFSVLFGLSMDYHVFLMSRIKERYDHRRHDESLALESHPPAIITGAALIMVAVFGGFARGPLMFQEMGFGLAVALILDATLIRSVLLPGAMSLLGHRNWYLPRWLDWLPQVHIEGRPDPVVDLDELTDPVPGSSGSRRHPFAPEWVARRSDFLVRSTAPGRSPPIRSRF